MPFGTLDAILAIALLIFAIWGFVNGFIRALGGLIAIGIGIVVASRGYLALAEFITPWLGGRAGLASIVAFAVIFLIVAKLIGLLVALVEQAFEVVAIIPFLKTINRLLGLIFGFALGVLVVGTVLFVLSKHSPWETLNAAMIESWVAQWILMTSSFIQPFFPETVRRIQSFF